MKTWAFAQAASSGTPASVNFLNSTDVARFDPLLGTLLSINFDLEGTINGTQYIDNEDSRALCRTIMECDGNVSEAARRLGMKESTIRYRLNLLIPKLLAKGFKVVSEGEFHERKHGHG